MWRLRFELRHPILDQEAAKDVVQAVLTGKVLDVHTYKNLDSSSIFIATLVQPNNAFMPLVVILEQVGGSYRPIWKSSDIIVDSIRKLEVVDSDNDGFHEVVLSCESWGTGARSWTIVVYFHLNNQTYQLTETLEHQELAGSFVPEVKLAPEPPKAIRKSLESIALERGLLQPIPKIEWDSPRFAIQRWHRDNGSRPSGKVVLTSYSGTPPPHSPPTEIERAKHFAFHSSVVTSLDDGHVVWTAYFKNPLVGYIASENVWFIAYSPANAYSWVTSVAHDGRRLWFATHLENGLWSFDLGLSELLFHVRIGSIELEGESRLRFENGKLYMGDGRSFFTKVLDEACIVHPRVPLSLLLTDGRPS